MREPRRCWGDDFSVVKIHPVRGRGTTAWRRRGSFRWYGGGKGEVRCGEQFKEFGVEAGDEAW